MVLLACCAVLGVLGLGLLVLVQLNLVYQLMTRVTPKKRMRHQ
jgi:hypothetical protein